MPNLGPKAVSASLTMKKSENPGLLREYTSHMVMNFCNVIDNTDTVNNVPQSIVLWVSTYFVPFLFL